MGKILWIRVAPFAPLALLSAACLATAGALSSCGRQAAPAVTEQPLRSDQVPIVRVLLGGGPTDRVIVSTTGGRIRVDGQDQGSGELSNIEVSRRGGLWKFNNLTVRGQQAEILPGPGHYVRLGACAYRGSLALLPAGDDRFSVINRVDLESYLAGVLSKELYPSWSKATYRALAVAARTFALYHVTTFGKSHEYDLGDDQNWQVYGGFTAETDKSWDAVRYTHGLVLTHGPRGKERIFMAQYSACCGGTVNGAYVIRDAPQIPPLLGGQTCEDCRGHRLYRWEPVRFRKADLFAAVSRTYPAAGAMDGLKEIQVAAAGPGDRPIWLDLVAPNGARIRIRAEDLRICILRSGLPDARRLYSMNCRIRDAGEQVEFYAGRGFGHGVGLCQWGAQGKAERGATALEILDAYYPGATLFRAY
ncbi:MAG TPA: SpoIID/LytB domain-containing protein [Phycisphaerae bacterium]|nr:SpoIID/LytB domain-containing protein [Phycisphaerae bacterium]